MVAIDPLHPHHPTPDGPPEAVAPKAPRGEPDPDSAYRAVAILGHTPVGTLRLSATAEGLRTVSFVESAEASPNPLSRSGSEAARALLHLRDAEATLRGYFAGVCTWWKLPLDLTGMSDFQKRVFQELLAIPFGEVRSYGDLAETLGGKQHSQAVGQAVGSNPIPILIPCHRVVQHDGRLGGFSGGLPNKATLLRVEGFDVEGASASSRVIEGGLRLDL